MWPVPAVWPIPSLHVYLKTNQLALRWSESGNCVFCVVYTQKDAASLWVGVWQREKQQNNLVECEIRVPIWKINFFPEFYGFPCFLDAFCASSIRARRRADARNVSFRISLRWPIHIINPVGKTNSSCKKHEKQFNVSAPLLLKEGNIKNWHVFPSIQINISLHQNYCTVLMLT